ncbi:MAG: ABC transporter permease, partial [Clostridiaceae bacterium]
MFFHNYIYRLKCILRDRQTIFWTLLFPIILAILFNLSLKNISSTETFSKIKIGIVNNEEFSKETVFKEAISSVSNSDKNPGKSNLFDVKYTSKEESEKLLQDNKIEGYIYFDNGLKLFVKKSGLNQTIIKSFLDDYKQTASTIQTIISRNPSVDHSKLISSISDRKDFLKEVQSSNSTPDTTVNYFYTLIAMACLYGGFMGLNEVIAIQADLSPQGARVNVAPTHKLKVFVVSIMAAATVSLSEIFILLSFLTFILKINFGTQIGYILLTCVVGTLTGVTFGTCIASVVKAGEGVKVGLLIGI